LSGVTIAVDGSLNEWGSAVSFGADPNDSSGVNTIDWASATIVHNDTDFYIGYQNHGAVTETWGHGVYIDVDGDINTGFAGFSSELPVGADYLIEGRVVQQYTGTGTNWSWAEVGSAQYAIGTDTVELAVPRSLLGDPSTLRLYFNGNNTAVGGSTVDYYPDGVADATLANIDRYFTYSIANNGGNSPPVALAQNLSVNTGQQLAVVLSGTDVDQDVLNYEIVDQPSNGTLTGTLPTLTYTPDTGHIGADQFTFTVRDASSTSAPAVISIMTVGGTTNNENTITVDGSLAEWAGISSFGSDPVDATGAGDQIDWLEGWVAHDAANFYFAYENNNPVTVSWGYGIYIDTDNSTATGFQNFDGSYPIGADYVIEANELLQYTGTGTDWSWSLVSINELQISGNTAEISIARSALGNPDQLSLFYVGENAANNGPTVDYYPDTALDASSASRTFTYDTGSQSVNVAPVATAQTLSLAQDTSIAVSLTATDANGDTLSYQVTRQPVNGTLTGAAPSLQYTPNGGFSGADSFEFRAYDGTVAGDPAVVTLSITPATNNANDTNFVSALTIDGNLQDWAGVTPLAADAADINNPGEKIDFRQGYIAHSDSMLYLAYQNDVPMSQLTYGHAAFIGTDDSDATGFKGFSSELPVAADFLLEGTDLYSYSGSGTNWLWTYVATVNARQVGSIAEIALSRAQLGNPSAIEIYWRGQNEAVGGTGVDFYPDAAGNPTAPVLQRSFRYVLQP